MGSVAWPGPLLSLPSTEATHPDKDRVFYSATRLHAPLMGEETGAGGPLLTNPNTHEAVCLPARIPDCRVISY